MTSTMELTRLVKFPVAFEKGFPSTKVHVIGMACLVKAALIFPVLLSHVQIVEL